MTWTIVVAALLLLAGSVVYLALYQRWESKRTAGTAYFALPLAARRALKRRIFWYSLPARPLVALLALISRRRTTMPAFEHQGVSAPSRVSSPEVFARAQSYRPRPEDVFVATQMRSGTTWMQQIVFQIVTRGGGALDDSGHGHLNAVSPWIDAINTVDVERAPLVGERPTRIIKTHLPSVLCPLGDEAKYIYVARHPVACFASIVDFYRSRLGPLIPPQAMLADWFCSDRMYWLPWPRHVDGWWRWAEGRGNALFVHYEELKSDFATVRERVARFLGCALTEEEKRRVDERCSFRYMKAHEERFDMAPPTMYSVTAGSFILSGKASRHGDVTPDIRRRIVDYCRASLAGARYPVARFYPDLAASTAGSSAGESVRTAA